MEIIGELRYTAILCVFFYRSFGCGFSTTLLGYARASPGYLTSQILISTSRIISPRFRRDPSPPSRVLAVLEARALGVAPSLAHQIIKLVVPQVLYGNGTNLAAAEEWHPNTML